MGYWIVVVDDEPLSLTNAKNLLHEQNMRVNCLRSGKDLLEFIKNHTPDLILLDIVMPQMDGFETYWALRQFEESEGRSQIPVIFLTGEDDSETERRGLIAGASDYIHKPFDEHILAKRINNAIVNSKRIEILKEEASYDKLTGFLNKASGTEKVSELCRFNNGTLMIMDLDNFKLVNDLFGHDMGDRFLVAFADIVKRNLRAGDVVSRVGGDEFMAFLVGMKGEEDVAAFTERLNAQLLKEAESLMGKEHGIPLGISIGVAIVSGSTDEFSLLFQYADSALYGVKRNGKHGFGIYDTNAVSGNQEEDLESELLRILQIVSERNEAKGAMLLGQDAFAWNYRFIERYLLRYGGAVSRILFSLSSDENGVAFSEMLLEFGNVLKSVLRKTDIILQWQQNQYLVAMPQFDDEDDRSVIERILQEWGETKYRDRARIKYVTSMLKRDGYESKDS